MRASDSAPASVALDSPTPGRSATQGVALGWLGPPRWGFGSWLCQQLQVFDPLRRHHLALQGLLALALLGLLASCALPADSKFDPRAKAEGAATTDTEGKDFTTLAAEKTIDPAWHRAPTAAPKLGPGDKFDIDIVGEAGARAQTFATPDGKIYYNLLPGIPVTGRTIAEVKSDLDTALAQYYRRPQVSINLIESVSQRVWILGRVSSPGMYPIDRPMRILDAVTAAGGFFASALSGTSQELADLSHSFLIRKGEVLPVDLQALFKDGDLSQNIYLQPSDYLYFPSSLNNEIYVLGAVKQPRPVGFTADMNIVAAVSAGHGFNPEADPRHIVIVRGSLTRPQVASINFPDILVGKASNFRLQPNDIVFVPTRWQSSMQGYGSIATRILGNTSRLAISSFASVVGANEGARISQPQSLSTPAAAAVPEPAPASATTTSSQP